ncbi:hypothetical protein [Polyangium fumosum]|nr:hypothetical protein [Polyangium fumosum]
MARQETTDELAELRVLSPIHEQEQASLREVEAVLDSLDPGR